MLLFFLQLVKFWWRGVFQRTSRLLSSTWGDKKNPRRRPGDVTAELQEVSASQAFSRQAACLPAPVNSCKQQRGYNYQTVKHTPSKRLEIKDGLPVAPFSLLLLARFHQQLAAPTSVWSAARFASEFEGREDGVGAAGGPSGCSWWSLLKRRGEQHALKATMTLSSRSLRRSQDKVQSDATMCPG